MVLKKKVHLVSLGCPKARVDAEMMIGQMQAAGFEHTDDPALADAIVVNTCSFLQSAVDESIDSILAMSDYKTEGRCQNLVVTGCLPSRYGKELADELPEVDLFLGTSDIDKIAAALQRDLPERTYISEGSFLYDGGNAPRVKSMRGASAYLKVAEGCSRSCTFCIIPKIRGKQRSRSVTEVLGEARLLAAQGIKEVVLIAQDLTSYGVDLGDNRSLITLLEGLETIPGLRWVRLMYAYPWNFTDELLSLIKDSDRVLPYIDMPLQHISDRILKAMRRNVLREKQLELIDKLRAVPGMVLRTTLITGFPGETDAEFQELADWIQDVGFDRVGAFAYSPEPGTPAAEMPDQVDPEVAEARRGALLAIQQGIHEEKMRKMIGERLEVLVDGPSDEHPLVLEGRYYGQAPEIDGVVYLSFEDGGSFVRPGEFVEVEIEDASEYDLVGVVLAEP